MKQSITKQFIGAALFGLLAAPVLAEDEPAKEKSPAAIFESLDANKDGKLTKEEAGEERARFFGRLLRVADKNEDGALSKEEFIAGSQPAERPAQPANPTAGRGGFSDEMFNRLDQNGDGKLTLKELPEQARARMKPLFDRLNKEELTKDDLRRVQGTGNPQQNRFQGPAIMRALDANKDGKLSKEELAKAADKFEMLDANKDGSLDTRELFGFTGRPDMAKQGDSATYAKRSFERLDANKDGKISGDEFPADAKERMLRFDANKDGELTEEELLTGIRRFSGQDRRPGTRQNPKPKSDD